METDRTTQEVLLNLHASFCKREWCEKQDGTPSPTNQVERLKTICWDGMLPELLPEISIKENNKPLVLWEMMGTSHLLHLKLGCYQQRLEDPFSIQPYILRDNLCVN